MNEIKQTLTHLRAIKHLALHLGQRELIRRHDRSSGTPRESADWQTRCNRYIGTGNASKKSATLFRSCWGRNKAFCVGARAREWGNSAHCVALCNLCNVRDEDDNILRCVRMAQHCQRCENSTPKAPGNIYGRQRRESANDNGWGLVSLTTGK